MKKALVLSGGGAKGSYQIGVWKALRKLHMKFDIVTGVSIGSINGAFYVQNQYYLARRMWKKVKTKDFFDYDIGNALSKEEYKGLFKEIITNGGMSFDKAGEFLKKYINEDKIRKSKIDFGLITVSLTTKKPRSLTKEMIPYGKLTDYICASSICYPFVSKKEIDGEYFIDGGFYDGIPINLAIDMGATDILAVDLNVFSLIKPPKNKDVNIDTIKFHDNVPLTLSFNKKMAIKNMKFGYNDTMKHFNKLDGNIYTFKKDSLKNNYKKIEGIYLSLIKDILLDKNRKSILEIFNIKKFNSFFNNIKSNKSIKKELNEAIEYLGEVFSIPKEKVYSISTFNRILLKNINDLSYIKINKNLTGKFLISYIYNKYTKENNITNIKKELYNIALLFPKEFMAALYLICLTKKYDILIKGEELYVDILKTLNLK